MSANTSDVLDGLRERAMAVGMTETQQRFRMREYVEARSKTPAVLVCWHDLSGLWRGFGVGQLRWLRRQVLAQEVR